jgi:hypothetical protein
MMKQAPRINVSPDDADGVYSNLVLVAFSKAEFVLDFARVMPGVSTAKIKSRIILSPHKIKALIKTLQGQVEAYEKANGKLEEGDSQTQIGFQNPAVIQETAE